MSVALLLLVATVAGARLGDLARRDTGDTFTLIGDECSPAQCAEHGAGASGSDGGGCACVCPQRAPLFREDRELCVDDLPECSLATFGTGASIQRIPFVYLPLKGQIIHPSKEITFHNVRTPICAVSGAQFLTRKGFLDLRNTLDADVPFNLFRDEGRTFLQWSGEEDVRTHMSGRVMVVRLLCRDVSAPPALPLDLRGVFTPCVAFRVQGTPPRQISNVTEVSFTPNAHTSGATTSSSLSVTEYVAIGISSLILGLIYVASVFLYLHVRKRRKAASSEGSTKRLPGLKKKDGSVITDRDIVRINNERVQTLPMEQDDGVVKKNPLLTMTRQFHDTKSSFPSDSGSNVSDSEDFPDSSVRSEESTFNTQTTSAVIHLRRSEVYQNDGMEPSHRDESGIERLPDEHVSIVETIDDREITRPVGSTRRKLYFNPAYFEPHLMADPPPAAIEFLTKIREVITIAKHKMAAKRFQPILNHIPEEETYPSNGNSLDIYQGLGSQRSGSVISLKRENSRKKSVNCLGCPGCKTDGNHNHINDLFTYNTPSCVNCLSSKGEKQNSIQKWLENIPIGKNQFNNDSTLSSNCNGLANSLLSLPTNDNRSRVRKQNSFSATSSLYSTDQFSSPKRSSTLSVRSEPTLRNYNIPLPEFDTSNYQQENYNFYSHTASRINNMRPFGINDRHFVNSKEVNNPHRINIFANNKNSLPDMVSEAIALDNSTKAYNHSSSDEEKYPNETNKIIKIYKSNNNSESPPGIDYETDSLERTSNKKCNSVNYSEISSQASPSLSNALPLEEELTMRNAIYKNCSSSSNTPSPHRELPIQTDHYESIGKIKGSIPIAVDNKNGNTDYSLVSEVYVNNSYNFGSAPTSPSGSECSLGSRKLNNNRKEEKPGSLTIEVLDSPENYIKIHESDGFEPDTLDRKQQKQKEILENSQFSRKDLLKYIDNTEKSAECISLRSSGIFQKNDKVDTTKFNSLRNEFENRKNAVDRPKLSPTMFSGSKSLVDKTEDNWEEAEEWSREEGRILTLEMRHSKRQRQSTPPTIKQMKHLARPDVLPPLPPMEDPIYEHPPFPPRKVINDVYETCSKNVNGRSLSPRTFTNNKTQTKFNDQVFLESQYGSSCSPMRASALQQSSDYENFEDPVPANERRNSGDRSRGFTRKSIGNSSNSINTNTFVKKESLRTRFRRKKGPNVDDSGYLSSDSTSSRQVPRKLVVAKIVSCSDSDDTENEARSESGAESVETHSVYFGSFRKLQANENNKYRDSRRQLNQSKR